MYNVESEIRKWRKMKEIEEKILRENGMDEDSIQILREYDWNTLKAERNYQTRHYVDSHLVENAFTTMELPINDLDDLLLQLDNEELFEIMKKIDHKLTIEIINLKIRDYSTKDIAQKLGMSVGKVNYYLRKVRKKIKK
ncbi:MAG: winged helix-turn-helix transcriptional regulator [Erysipelotrichaceae bacterium]|nr:winged helix-turn-helix transcriptional regulator [Erysipelotrichaceae bacterium]